MFRKRGAFCGCVDEDTLTLTRDLKLPVSSVRFKFESRGNIVPIARSSVTGTGVTKFSSRDNASVNGVPNLPGIKLSVLGVNKFLKEFLIGILFAIMIVQTIE